MTNTADTHKEALVKAVIYSIIIFIFLCLISIAGIIALNVTNGAASQKTDTSIQISMTAWTTKQAQQELNSWIPTALKVDEATIKKVELKSLQEGAKGHIKLTNGKTIPFTIHKEGDIGGATYTVEKG